MILAGLACVVALVGSASDASAAGAPPTPAASPLSAIGQAAVADVRSCLSTNTHLDVYYLVDASGSLFPTDPHGGTDPSKIRAGLIGNSLSELASVKPGLDVRYSSGFFGTRFKPGLPWTNVTTQSAAAESAKLHNSIASQSTLGATNWPAGIKAAAAALASEKARTHGCQILVWLTDGGINIDGTGTNDKLDDAGLNNLCGTRIKSDAPPSNDGLGPFNQMRKDGVVVFGVLLQVANVSSARDKANMRYMRPLVESTGQVGNATVDCGESPIPKDYVSGGLIVADNPSDLALVFLQLGAALSGGFPAPFNADGSFQIDPGVSSFSIVTPSKTWTLIDPTGVTVASSGVSSQDSRVSIRTPGGASEIRVTTSDAASTGKWKWASAAQSSDNLYLYSGLAISLTHPKSLLAGIPGAVKGRVIRSDGRPLDLSQYSYELSLSVVSADGKSIKRLNTATPSGKTGDFALSVPTNVKPGSLNLQVSLDPLATRPSASNLAPVSARETVPVTVPAEFPSASPVPLKMSELDGSSGHSTGVLVLNAPADGTTSGAICLSNLRPSITSDSVERQGSWVWSFTPAATASNSCVRLAAGSTKRITVSASNSIAANSGVRAQLPVTYVAASGKKIHTALQFTFTSVRPLNGAVVGGFGLLLLALGILIPLALLYLINFLGATIAYDSKTLRAAFPVRVHRDGSLTNPDGSDFRTLTFGLDQFKFRGPGTSAKRFVDEALGTLTARTSRNPFREPYFEIIPPAGLLVFSMVATQSSNRPEVEEGRRAPFGGVLSRLAAIVMPEGSLGALDTAPGASATFVVYTSGDGYAKRVSDVLANLPRIVTRMAKAKSLLEQKRPPNDSVSPRQSSQSAGNPAPPARDPKGQRAVAEPPPPPRRDQGSPPPAARRSNDTPPPANRAGGSVPPTARPSETNDPPPPPPRRR